MNSANFSDDRLRREFIRMRQDADVGETCPPIDSLWASARAELGGEENEELLLHLGECPACAAAWRFAQEVSPDTAPVSLDARRTGPGRAGWFRAAAVAATVIVAAGLGFLFLAPGDKEVPVYRTQGQSWLQSITPDGSAISRDRFVLKWTAGAEGTMYDIRVLGQDMKPLAEAVRLRETEYVVPAELLEPLSSGSIIYWQVTAHLPDGRLLESESYIATVE